MDYTDELKSEDDIYETESGDIYEPKYVEPSTNWDNSDPLNMKTKEGIVLIKGKDNLPYVDTIQNITPTTIELYSAEFDSLYGQISIREKGLRKIFPTDIEVIATIILKYNFIITAMENDTIFIYNHDEGIYSNDGDIQIKKYIEKKLGEYCKTEVINEILNKIRRKTYKSINVFVSNNKDFICLKNGVWSFSQHKLLPHSAEYNFINKLPLVYNPDAHCIKISKFLNEIVYPEKVQLLYELFGFCLLPEYKIQKAALLIGSGRNGKSVYLSLLKSFLGKENVSNQSIQKLSKDKFSTYQLFGKLANIFPDLSSEEIGDSSTFKTLTSGLDSISAEQKFKNSFDFINHSKLLFSCNQIPRSKDDSDAFYRRWIIIIFPFTFEGSSENKNLIDELTTEDELSGLLNIALEHSYRLCSDGEFSAAQKTDEVREIYTRLSDSVGSFILDKIDIAPEDYIVKEELYSKFVDYCRSFKFPIISEKMFSNNIFQKLPVTNFRASVDDKRPMCWKGIGWKTLQEQEYVKKETLGE